MCCSVHRHKIEYIFFYFKVIFGQDNSIGSEDCKESPNIFIFQKKLNLSLSNVEKTQNNQIAISNILNMGRRNFKDIFVNYKKFQETFLADNFLYS